MVEGLWLRVQCLWLRVDGKGCRVYRGVVRGRVPQRHKAVRRRWYGTGRDRVSSWYGTGRDGVSSYTFASLNSRHYLHRNVQRFRGGLVFKAHGLLRHTTLGLRVIQKKVSAQHPSRRCEDNSDHLRASQLLQTPWLGAEPARPSCKACPLARC